MKYLVISEIWIFPKSPHLGIVWNCDLTTTGGPEIFILLLMERRFWDRPLEMGRFGQIYPVYPPLGGVNREKLLETPCVATGGLWG